MRGRELLHGRSPGIALSRLVALTVVFVGLTIPSSDARWRAPQLVGHSKIRFALVNSPFVPNETRPVVAFDRSGRAGLAFVDGVSTFLAERSPGGRFASPVLLAPGSAGVVNPLGLAFTTNGATVGLLHAFDDVGGPATSIGHSGRARKRGSRVVVKSRTEGGDQAGGRSHLRTATPSLSTGRTVRRRSLDAASLRRVRSSRRGDRGLDHRRRRPRSRGVPVAPLSWRSAGRAVAIDGTLRGPVSASRDSARRA
jgi:hypothetical protein